MQKDLNKYLSQNFTGGMISAEIELVVQRLTVTETYFLGRQIPADYADNNESKLFYELLVDYACDYVAGLKKWVVIATFVDEDGDVQSTIKPVKDIWAKTEEEAKEIFRKCFLKNSKDTKNLAILKVTATENKF